LSDDGDHGLTIIAFIGSVFSPYYAWARRHAGRSGADPLNHCAVNVALYGRGGQRWAMTERGRDRVQREACTLQIGPSALKWSGDTLRVELDEIAVPWPSRIRGSVTLRAPRRYDCPVELATGHQWCPIAPAARVEVDLGALRWSGPGYLDSNRGEVPLERSFLRWDWSRAQLAGGDSVVLYDVERLGGEPLQLGLRFDASTGLVGAVAPPPPAWMPAAPTWRVARGGRTDAGTRPRVLRTLTDAPFYARSLVEAQWLGERVTAMHESLSLVRFDSAWVQAMLPFRMPRRPR
jgi:carotenoid 1,2-hydratase